MSTEQSITRTLIAAIAALLVSSIAVGSAVAPAQVGIAPVQTVNA
jgi:hypothetical protein